MLSWGYFFAYGGGFLDEKWMRTGGDEVLNLIKMRSMAGSPSKTGEAVKLTRGL